MITYGSTTLTSYNTITKIEVYYYKSTSATSLSGGSWSTTKPTWENGKYIWQKIRTTYEGKLENGQYYSESDPVNITGQQGATGTAAYSYKLNASDTIVTKSETGELSTPTITFSAIFKQGTSAITPYAGRFKIEVTTDKVTWVIVYPTSGTGIDESSVTFTIPENTALIKCSLYQAGGLTVLLDHITIPIVNDGVGTVEPPYKEVEWVESTGKQYVYLDWKPPIKTWGFEIDFINRNAVNTSMGAWNESTNVNGFGTIFGVRNASGVNNCQLSSYSNGLLRIGNSTNIATGFKTDHSRQTIKLQGTTVTKTDGTTATVTRVDENTVKPYCNMTVFALYTGLRCQDTGGISEPSSTRIYSLKFYDGTTLTVDLVGTIRKADGVTGLYDKVSRHFYPAPGMLFGDEVGNINDTDTVAESLNKADVNVTVVNKNRTRMWETAVPFNRLEDGQKITVTYSYGNVVNSIETAELPEWNESTTSGNNRIYLKLTYPNGSKSEWIPCYYAQTTRLTTHYGAGTPITLTYHENILSNATETVGGSPVVRGFFANPVYDSNYYDRRLHNNSIKAKVAINTYHLICGDEEGYQNIDASVSFDLGYPILYATGNIAATKTATNTYEAMPGVNFTYTGTIQNGAANKMLWLKGTIRGNIFTLASTNFLTTQIPTSDDGMYYIPLGIMSSATEGYFSSSNRIYAYIDEEFQPLDNAAALKASSAYETAVQARSEIVQTQQTLSLQIRDISVGGANLFERTKTFEGTANQSTAHDSFTEFVYRDLTVKSANTITFGNQVVELSAYQYTDLTSNMWYSFSFYAKGNVDIGFMYAGTGNAVIDSIDVSWDDNIYTGFNTTSTSSNIIWLTPTSNWQRYSVVFHIEEQDITALHRLIGLYARPVNGYTELATENKDILITETGTDVHLIMEGNEVQICGYKLELGNKPTDWTPADNDKATYDNIISQINLSKEGIAIRADKIRLEGMITANEGFSIDEYGNMTANNGTFNGIFESYATEINENTFDLSINNGHIQFYNNDRTLTEDERYVGYIGGIRKNTSFIDGSIKNNDAITISLYNNSDFLIDAYDDTTSTPVCEVMNYVTGKPTFNFWVPARIYDGNKLQMYSRYESHGSQIEFRRYSKNTGGYVSRGSLSLHSIQDNSDISDRLYLLSKNQGNDLAGDQFLYFAGKGLRYSSSGQPMRTGYVATDKYIVTQYFSLPDLTIAKNTSQNFTIDVSRDGYTPIMCIPKVGGGQNAFYLSIYTWGISGNIATIYTHNNSSTSDVSNVTITLQVLYKLTY